MSLLAFPALKEQKAITEAMRRADLMTSETRLSFQEIPGGLSSEVWLVKGLSRGPVVAKRALHRLRVTQEWTVDVARTKFEALWTAMTSTDAPLHVPQGLGYDAESGFLFLSYLPPPDYRQWREVLLSGEIDCEFASQVGQTLALLHSCSANEFDRLKMFDNANIFAQSRIDPYFDFVEKVHPDIQKDIQKAKLSLTQHAQTVIHGDISPKNILVGPNGPVFLDAECACASDPAFDLPFCLAQLLLKELVSAAAPGTLSDAAKCCARAYMDNVSWEPKGPLEVRMVKLLAIFMLARVDGKAPVPYIREEGHKVLVRRFAKTQLLLRPQSLENSIERWSAVISQWRPKILM